jgi:hypothetical protein
LCVGEFHPSRRELRTGEFRPSHDELGRKSTICAWAGSAWAVGRCTWAGYTSATASWVVSAPAEMSAVRLRPGQPPRVVLVERALCTDELGCSGFFLKLR